jgi:hypothetical protein
MVAAPSVYNNVAALTSEHIQLSTGLSCLHVMLHVLVTHGGG